MLVSLMARMNAITQMHNAQYAMMQNRINMLSMCRNMPTFCGNDPSRLAMLNDMDKRIATSNATNETMYMIASAQEKAAAQMIANEQKNNANHISYIA
jgi:hypothetical protein